jgi:hypothetical protein
VLGWFTLHPLCGFYASLNVCIVVASLIVFSFVSPSFFFNWS